MKKTNLYKTREEWLFAGYNELHSYFRTLGYKLPDNVRFALSFTSGGKRGMEGECWHSEFSADNTFEIIVKADRDDPVEILGILVHQLVHTLLPPEAKHGKTFRDIALRVGMEGRMSHALPAPPLRERLTAVADALGPLPHAKLDLLSGAIGTKKSGAKMLKVECAQCGYNFRILPKWAKYGFSLCAVDPSHGVLSCNDPAAEEPLSPAPPLIYNDQTASGFPPASSE